MAKEPEPKNRGSSYLPFSAEAQLDVFRKQLDEDSGRLNIIKVLPGFLFRDGRERRKEFTPAQFRDSSYNWRWVDIDEKLLERLTRTYKEGLEARRLLLERLRPNEILGVVREMWGGGDISTSSEGATLGYTYLTPVEARLPTTQHYQMPSILDNYQGRYSYGGGGKTGKWYCVQLRVEQAISVRFGNREYPDINTLPYSNVAKEFFADYYFGSRESHVEFPYTNLPNQIWQRPDNLIVHVKIPYVLKQVTGIYYYRNPPEVTYFDPSVQQQEIIDFLAQRLETQKITGKLPSQVASVELSKIEELRRRGLFIEGKPQTPIYYPHPVYKGWTVGQE